MHPSKGRLMRGRQTARWLLLHLGCIKWFISHILSSFICVMWWISLSNETILQYGTSLFIACWLCVYRWRRLSIPVKNAVEKQRPSLTNLAGFPGWDEQTHFRCRFICGLFKAFKWHSLSLRRVLILHLKRYSYNSQLSLNSKLGQQVLIPKYLTLLSHCTDATRPPLSLGWSAQTAM